jgi:hypothetical protein
MNQHLPLNIRQPGVESRQLIHIRDSLNQGVLITHILNIKISNEPVDRNHARILRNLIKIGIHRVPLGQNILFNQQLVAAVVIWDMPGVTLSSAYYYTATYLNDLALALHTRLALATICAAIRQHHPEFGNNWGISYLVTKPLDFLNQQLLHGDLALPNNGVDNTEEDNDDVEEDEEDE